MAILAVGCGAGARASCPENCPCCVTEPIVPACPAAQAEADGGQEAPIEAQGGHPATALDSTGMAGGNEGEAEPVLASLPSGWSYAVEEISGTLDATSFRWLQDGGLLFATGEGWKLWDGVDVGSLEGEALKKTLKAGKLPWEKTGKWRVYFQVYAASGGPGGEEMAGKVAARVEVCLKKQEDLCNVHTFFEGLDEPFPWTAADVPSETEALDLILFKGADRLVIARGAFAVRLDMAAEPPALMSNGEAGEADPAEACDGILPGEPRGNFAGIEMLDDLSAFIGSLQGTAYTADGRGYVYGKSGGVWLATFMEGAEAVLLAEVPGEPLSVAWSPGGREIAILDSEQRLFVAKVQAPGEPPLVTVEEASVQE